jgi:hypothetical protein
MQWARGFVPPSGVTPEDVMAALARLPEPSPANLLEAAKAADHVLHEHFWGKEAEKHWAKIGRDYGARKLVASVYDVQTKGGREITFRAVEVVKVDGRKRWATMEEIADDAQLMAQLIDQVIRLLEQITGKLMRLRELQTERDARDAAE